MTLTLRMRMTGMISTMQSEKLKEGHSGLTSLKTVELLRDSGKINKEELTE